MTQLLLDFSETLTDADGDTVVVDRLSDTERIISWLLKCSRKKLMGFYNLFALCIDRKQKVLYIINIRYLRSTRRYNMSKFFIYYCDGYVDYENQPTNNFDNVELFDTEEKAVERLKTYQNEWRQHLAVGIIEM